MRFDCRVNAALAGSSTNLWLKAFPWRRLRGEIVSDGGGKKSTPDHVFIVTVVLCMFNSLPGKSPFMVIGHLLQMSNLLYLSEVKNHVVLILPF